MPDALSAVDNYLVATRGTSEGAGRESTIDSLVRIDPQTAKWALAHIILVEETFTLHDARRAATAYRRHFGAALPILVTAGTYGTSLQRLYTALNAIDQNVDTATLSLAWHRFCTAQTLLRAAEKASSVSRGVATSSLEPFATEARQVQDWVDSVLAASERHAAPSGTD
jgi:hypothetical protein